MILNKFDCIPNMLVADPYSHHFRKAFHSAHPYLKTAVKHLLLKADLCHGVLKPHGTASQKPIVKF